MLHLKFYAIQERPKSISAGMLRLEKNDRRLTTIGCPVMILTDYGNPTYLQVR